MLRRPTSRVDAAFAAGWLAVPRLPRRVSRGLFDLGARVALSRGDFDQLRRNLHQAVGHQIHEEDLDDLVRRGVRSYVRYWREVFQLPTWDRQDVIARTVETGWDNVQQPLDAGRGVVVALTHSGNWDASAIHVITGRGVPMTTVAERLAPESLFERFRAYRESLGMEVAALTGDAEPSAVKLKHRLTSNGMVTLPADRDLAGKGIAVELCGRRTTMPSGPALLAIQTGAALVPLRQSFTPDGWRVDFYPEIDVPEDGRLRQKVAEMTQDLANHFTDFIRFAPQDWHMFQRLWPDV